MVKYKVVRQTLLGTDKIHGTSVVATGPLHALYSTDEFTTAPIGGLLVFNHFEDAKIWRNQMNTLGLEVWKVEAEEPVHLPKARLNNPSWPGRDCEYIWNDRPDMVFNEADSRYCGVAYGWPNGTEAYKKIKLLEKVL